MGQRHNLEHLAELEDWDYQNDRCEVAGLTFTAMVLASEDRNYRDASIRPP